MVDLTSNEKYMEYLTVYHPLVLSYAEEYSNAGYTPNETHKQLSHIYEYDMEKIKNYYSPSEYILKQIGKSYFDESKRVNDRYNVEHLGDGTYYNRDYGTTTTHIQSLTLKEFFIDMGLNEEIAEELSWNYNDVKLNPEEYVVVFMHEMHKRIELGYTKELDMENIVRWGRKVFMKYAYMDTYLFNFVKFKEFILKEKSAKFMKKMVKMTLREFTSSYHLISLLGILNGRKTINKVLGKSSDDLSPLERAKKYVRDKIHVREDNDDGFVKDMLYKQKDMIAKARQLLQENRETISDDEDDQEPNEPLTGEKKSGEEDETDDDDDGIEDGEISDASYEDDDGEEDDKDDTETDDDEESEDGGDRILQRNPM